MSMLYYTKSRLDTGHGLGHPRGRIDPTITNSIINSSITFDMITLIYIYTYIYIYIC